MVINKSDFVFRTVPTASRSINQIIQQQLHNPVLLKALVELQQDFPTDRWLCSTRDSTSSCMIGNVAVIRLGLLAHTERGPH